MSSVVPRIAYASFILALGCGAGATSSEPTGGSSEAETLPGSPVTGLGGKCLDVFGGSTADGATVGIWDCHGPAWQDWSYQNENLVGIGGKCLDVNGAGTANGTRVQLYGCNGTVAQVWQLMNGELVNPNSGKCLDVTGDQDVDGAVVQIWDCWSGPNQQWSFSPVAPPSPSPSPSPPPPPTPAPAPAPAPDASAGSSFASNCTYAGGIYYVAPTGSDSAEGSKGAPWATLDHASASVRPGDTVRIRGNAGTYTPATQPTLQAQGTSTQWICFEGDPEDAMPIFDGSHVGGSDPDGIFIGGQYVVLQNLVITNARQYGIEVGSGGHFIDIVGNNVTNSAWDAIRLGLGTSDTSATSDIRVHGNDVSNNGVAGSAGPAAEVSGTNWPSIVHSWGASNISITGNTIHENWGEGIGLNFTRGGEATDNVIWDNWSVNLYLDNAANIDVVRNFIYDTGNARFVRPDTGVGPAGIQVAEEDSTPGASIVDSGDSFVDNITVNCSSGFNYGSYGLNLGLQGAIIAGNTFFTNRGGDPLSIGDAAGHSNNHVFDNILVGDSVGIPGSFSTDHNLFSGVPNAGGSGGAGNVSADPLFVNAGAFSATAYQLQAGSPARGAGASDPALTSDFGGAARGNPPSIGAWE